MATTALLVKVVLASDVGLSDWTEDDFDAWGTFVAERIDHRTGFNVEVDEAPFGDSGEDEVVIVTRVSPEEHENAVETVRESLRDLWEEFCATPEAWPTQAAL